MGCIVGFLAKKNMNTKNQNCLLLGYGAPGTMVKYVILYICI
jgi:hypothetical protein